MGQVLFLMLFLAVGVEAAPVIEGNEPPALLTGNVTQLVVYLVEIAHPHGERAEALARLRKMALAVATFMLGALIGALGYRFAGRAIPVATTAAVLWEQAPVRETAIR